MDRREIAALLAYLGRIDPRTIRTDEGEAGDQLAQWYELLNDVPMATPYGWDARDAARQHIRTSPYPILPADVARPWEQYRRDRLRRHTDPTPTSDPDDQAAWRAELASVRRAVATGAAPPAQHELANGQGHSEVLEERLRQIGSCIPPEARAALAPFRPGRARREAALAEGRPDPLTVHCTWCKAQIGERCRRISGARGTALLTATNSHPSRIELAERSPEHTRA
ncbi:hypothetical protein JGS22_015220 [Streptomyces sp. P38-E01]|uniref:DNA-binding phage zinc finger domain-containing protein n=1 Tax=Streptomyces tardus TaxID=2780544 RepID=A0A949N8U2_9ACTN|nr:hypothetical protein [Streptomyces tardus]MBU7598926.1 hypothetical protein [Streptomyces tardus]